MRAFSDAHPEIGLTLAVGNRQEVLDRLRSHAVDVAISGRPPNDDNLISEPLSDNEIVCITDPDDPAASGGTVAAAELAERVWLLREPGSGTRALNEQFLAESGLTPVTLTLGSNGAIKQAVRAGLGISLLSRAAVEGELESRRLRELCLQDGPPARPWFLVRSAVGPSRPSVEAFGSFVQALAAPSVRSA
jgi:DNA-binding transcriptional LysR family regulator